jgi:hypothetical protein
MNQQQSRKWASGMKTILIFSAMMLFAGSAFSQGMGQRRAFYDQSTVTTITGTIQSVDTLSGRRGNFHMIQLTVKDSSGTVAVNVGPTFYLDEQKISFKAGDAVVVTGSRVQFNGTDVILAAQVKDGDKAITLRDDSGRPVWARGGMK